MKPGYLIAGGIITFIVAVTSLVATVDFMPDEKKMQAENAEILAETARKTALQRAGEAAGFLVNLGAGEEQFAVLCSPDGKFGPLGALIENELVQDVTLIRTIPVPDNASMGALTNVSGYYVALYVTDEGAGYGAYAWPATGGREFGITLYVDENRKVYGLPETYYGEADVPPEDAADKAVGGLKPWVERQ